MEFRFMGALKESKSKALRLFCAVLALNVAYSLVTFFLYFDSRESNISSAVYSLLRLVPLVVLIVLCVRVRNITDRARLSVIKKCLIAYLAIDALLGLVAFRFSLPRPIGCLFYAKGWWFCIVYMIRYEMFHLAVDLALVVLYWVAFGFLLVEISDRIVLRSDSDAREVTAASESTGAPAGQKTSSSFKIALASMILLVVQTAITGAIMAGWSRAKVGTTGMQAIGLAFVALIVMAGKFVFSLPVLVLSIVGIVKARRPNNKPLTRNREGLWINIVCLVLSEVQVFLMW